MENILSKINLIYFSATGTTKNIVNAIGRMLSTGQVREYNLSHESKELYLNTIPAGSLTIIGTPVYRGRVPMSIAEKLQKLHSSGSSAVLVSVYGNRHFDDALLELNDIAIGCGFKVIGAGAFIGEHSYSTDERPIAHKRPDKEDLDQCARFAEAIKAKITTAHAFETLDRTKLPGNHPYKEHPAIPLLSPDTIVDECILCGICAEVCPTDAITVKKEVITDKGACIWCCACVKRCPSHARIFKNKFIDGFVEMLSTHCKVRKQPEWYI